MRDSASGRDRSLTGRRIAVLFSTLSFLGMVLPLGQASPADVVLTYEILGLRLGMTAQDAESIIQQRLKLSPGLAPDAYKVNSTPRRYRDSGTFIDECVISNSKMELILDFTEVFPGKGQGAEALYYISYTPKPVSTDDKDEFARRVVAKFGPPTVKPNQTNCYWVAHPYRSKEEAIRADAPVLELDKSLPKLTLSNVGIRRRMEDAFRETQKIPL